MCGSWALFIYRRWILDERTTAPVRTRDVDLAVPSRLRMLATPVDQRLREAGFEERLESDAAPPVSRFELGGAPHLEFVTPHKGNREQGTREVQDGLSAQELRYLEVILDDPEAVAIPGTSLRVRVASPAAYLYQKGLSFVKRGREDKKAKDLAYLFDLLHNLPAMRDEAVPRIARLAQRHPPSWFRTFRANLRRYFPAEPGEGVRMIESQSPAPYADMLRRDPTNGRALFREVVRRTFAELLRDLDD